MKSRQTYHQFLASEIPSIIQILTLPTILITVLKSFVWIAIITIFTSILLWMYLANAANSTNPAWKKYVNKTVIGIILILAIGTQVQNVLLLYELLK